MRNARFVDVRERLLRAGVAPRHARRAVLELTEHFEDLIAELQGKGLTGPDAEAEAIARLNPDALVAAASVRPELHSWMRRWPLISCTAFPLGMYLAYVVGSIALLAGSVTAIDHTLGVQLASSHELQRFTALFLSAVVWAAPVFAAATLCSTMLACRAPLAWTVVGAALISLLGASLNAGLLLPPDDRPGIEAGFGFSTDALAQPLLRTAVTLTIVLPIYFWRCSTAFGGVSALPVSRFAATMLVIALHAVMLALLASALRPDVGRRLEDTPMTLIVVPPAAAPPSIVAERLAPVPAPPRGTFISPPLAPPPDILPAWEERAPIDWARAAELAVRSQVDAIELERRRARGFTPGAQNREPELAPAPIPAFGWSRAAIQPIETLPDGGILLRLNDRCVIVINPLPLPFCGIGEIPVNGGLFEHMNDPPVAGDWKD